MVHHVKLVTGAEGVILDKAPKKKRVDVTCDFSKQELAKMKRISGLTGKSYSDQQIIVNYIKSTLYAN